MALHSHAVFSHNQTVTEAAALGNGSLVNQLWLGALQPVWDIRGSACGQWPHCGLYTATFITERDMGIWLIHGNLYFYSENLMYKHALWYTVNHK